MKLVEPFSANCLAIKNQCWLKPFMSVLALYSSCKMSASEDWVCTNIKLQFLHLPVPFSPPLFIYFSCPSPLHSLFLHKASFWWEKFSGKLLVLICRIRKREVGNEQVFIGILGSVFTCTCFLPFSLASLTEMCSFWHHLKHLFPLHKYK